MTGKLRRSAQEIVMMNGQSVTCDASLSCDLVVEHRRIEMTCLVAEVLPGFNVLLGMDAISTCKLGGVHILGKRSRGTV